MEAGRLLYLLKDLICYVLRNPYPMIYFPLGTDQKPSLSLFATIDPCSSVSSVSATTIRGPSRNPISSAVPSAWTNSVHYKGNDTGSGAGCAGQPGALNETGLDGPDDDRQAAAQGVGPTGKEQPQLPGEAETHWRTGTLGMT